MDAPQEWLDLWRRAAEADLEGDRRLVADVCGGIHLVTDDGPDDPEEVIALAIAGAEAAEATAAGLDHEWALYTPQQAAVVASALFAQIEAAGAALEKLGEYLHVMDARQDVVMPEFDGHDDLNLSNAEMFVGATGEEAQGVTTNAADAVRILAQTPYLGVLPTDAHETITAVAGLLGDEAKLNTDHHIQDETELAQNYSSGFGCGCRITLHDSVGSPWEFERGDSSWNLLRLADVDEAGIVHTWTELDATDACAHPGHVTALIRQALSAPT
ncbi:hypothetical protein [Streptomyces sp. WAC01526]|uniref:hypothetical protein n=1 Tax=Streptomyces sp. WAC01526 TaxID=2588709 RepID=UPI0011DFE3A6|nr:hypothetical protein [Streptomyces sp. WAC01526]